MLFKIMINQTIPTGIFDCEKVLCQYVPLNNYMKTMKEGGEVYI